MPGHADFLVAAHVEENVFLPIGCLDYCAVMVAWP
jgi:hypothetical protein